MFKKLLQLTLVASALISLSAIAKPVNLYEQPDAKAKVVGTLDSNNELIPIITNKQGDWMKVGNPKDGAVGWIKVSDMGSTNGMGVSFTERTVPSDSGPHTIRTIKFETPQVISPAETQAWVKELQKRQDDIQKYSQQLMKHVSDEMNAFYKQYPNLFNPQNMPIIMPIIVMPQPAGSSNNWGKPAAAKPASSQTQPQPAAKNPS